MGDGRCVGEGVDEGVGACVVVCGGNALSGCLGLLCFAISCVLLPCQICTVCGLCMCMHASTAAAAAGQKIAEQ
jgi:hypothetical protein